MNKFFRLLIVAYFAGPSPGYSQKSASSEFAQNCKNYLFGEMRVDPNKEGEVCEFPPGPYTMNTLNLVAKGCKTSSLYSPTIGFDCTKKSYEFFCPADGSDKQAENQQTRPRHYTKPRAEHEGGPQNSVRGLQ